MIDRDNSFISGILQISHPNMYTFTYVLHEIKISNVIKILGEVRPARLSFFQKATKGRLLLHPGRMNILSSKIHSSIFDTQ